MASALPRTARDYSQRCNPFDSRSCSAGRRHHYSVAAGPRQGGETTGRPERSAPRALTVLVSMASAPEAPRCCRGARSARRPVAVLPRCVTRAESTCPRRYLGRAVVAACAEEGVSVSSSFPAGRWLFTIFLTLLSSGSLYGIWATFQQITGVAVLPADVGILVPCGCPQDRAPRCPAVDNAGHARAGVRRVPRKTSLPVDAYSMTNMWARTWTCWRNNFRYAERAGMARSAACVCRR